MDGLAQYSVRKTAAKYFLEHRVSVSSTYAWVLGLYGEIEFPGPTKRHELNFYWGTAVYFMTLWNNNCEVDNLSKTSISENW